MNRTVLVGGAPIAVGDTGSGRPVVLLHGVPETSAIFEPVVAQLSDRFRCLTPDLPGFGGSGVPAGFNPRFAGLGAFVAQMLDALGISEPVDLVMHDFGGAFGMAFAGMNPDRVRRMIVMSSPFFVRSYTWHTDAKIWRTPVAGEAYMAALSWPTFYLAMRRTTTTLSTATMRQMYARITPEMRQMVLRLYRAASPAEFADWEPRMLAATDACPTLAVWGSDPYVPGWVAMRIGAQQERHWGACGHWLPTEAPERVAGEVIRWLGDPDEVASEREAHPPSPTIDE